MRNLLSLITLVLLAAFVVGCGETVTGMVKDTKRIGAGVKKVFIRE